MKKALVTGAPGFVGSNLCRELLNNGYEVVALHRKTSDISTLEGLDVQKVVGDITDPETLKEPMKGVDVVFHIAALFRQAKHEDDVYWKINVEGTRNVLEAAEQAGVDRVIHCSTVGVHSHIPNPPASEGEEFRPGDIYQETKCEGEKVAQEWFQSGRIKGAVIRPAMIWGPGDQRTLKLFKGIATGKFPLIGTGATLAHWVLVTDLARGFRQAAETDKSIGQTYILAGEKPVTLSKLYLSIASATDGKLWPFKIPATPMQILGSIVEIICKPLGIEPPIYRRRVDFFTKDRAFNTTKAKEELGYAPEYTFDKEVAHIGAWYKQAGWI